MELIPILGRQPAGDMSHKPGGRLPSLLFSRPAVTLATLKRAAISFAAWWTGTRWVWTVCLRLLPDSDVAAIWTQALLRLSPTLGYQATLYECVVLCKDISLQGGRFCTRSLASCIPRSSEDRSSWMFIIQVVHSRPGGRLQFSGGASQMAWLASAFSSICARCPKTVRQQDLMMDESRGWLVVRRMSAFLTKLVWLRQAQLTLAVS